MSDHVSVFSEIGESIMKHLLVLLVICSVCCSPQVVEGLMYLWEKKIMHRGKW